jgi:hypothetical protein
LKGGDAKQPQSEQAAALKSETLFFMDDFLFCRFVAPFLSSF